MLVQVDSPAMTITLDSSGLTYTGVMCEQVACFYSLRILLLVPMSCYLVITIASESADKAQPSPPCLNILPSVAYYFFNNTLLSNCC